MANDTHIREVTKKVRLIDGYKLWAEAMEYADTGIEFDGEGVANFIANAPTVDAVEVVRCKDCKYQGTGSCPTYYEDSMTYRDCWGLDGDNDFCSYGERREGE